MLIVVESYAGRAEELREGERRMDLVPAPLSGLFLITALLAVVGFWKVVRGSRPAIAVSLVWTGVQSAVALTGFYLVTDGLPPRFVLTIVPPMIVIALLFLTASGRRLLDRMDLQWSILIHTIRIFVELTLFFLFVYKQVPALMTFERGNLDILAGLSAPIMWWAYRQGRVGRRGLLVWNSLCFLGVLNALGRAVLSAPFRFQSFGFDQLTVAILRFPFILLPAFIVPVVLLCHLSIFRKLSAHGSPDAAVR